jgi:hypothetical protein
VKIAAVRRGIVSVVVLLACAGGCRPTVEYPISFRDQRRQGYAADLRSRGQPATADEVRRTLGTPEYANPDGSLVVYAWETIDTYEPVPAVTDHDDFDSMRDLTRHLLAMQFDAGGALLRHRHLRLTASRDVARHLDRLADQWDVPPVRGTGPATQSFIESPRRWLPPPADPAEGK